MRSLGSLVAVLALSSALAAQQFVASGRIQALPAAGCAPEASHTFQCGAVLLQSSAVDLSALEGQLVDVVGDLVLVPGCPEVVLQVASAESAQRRLTLFSLTNFRIGSSFTLLSTAPVGNVIVQLFAVESVAVPLGEFGTLFLNPVGAQQWAFDIGIGLPFPRLLSIPNNPALIGCNPHFQAVVVDPQDPLSARLTNDACFVVR